MSDFDSRSDEHMEVIAFESALQDTRTPHFAHASGVDGRVDGRTRSELVASFADLTESVIACTGQNGEYVIRMAKEQIERVLVDAYEKGRERGRWELP